MPTHDDFVKRCRPKGFTLLEVLIVLFTLGIMAGAGVSVYASLIRDTRIRTATDHLEAFVEACRRRAMERGVLVRLQYDGNRVIAVDMPTLTFAAEGWSEDSKKRLGSLTFRGKKVTDPSGTTVSSLNLAFELPGGKLEPVIIKISSHP